MLKARFTAEIPRNTLDFAINVSRLKKGRKNDLGYKNDFVVGVDHKGQPRGVDSKFARLCVMRLTPSETGEFIAGSASIRLVSLAFKIQSFAQPNAVHDKLIASCKR